MGLVVYLIIGVILGWLASVVVKQQNPNVVKDIVLGVIGAIVGDILARLFVSGESFASKVTTSGLIGVIVLSVIVIALGRSFNSKEKK